MDLKININNPRDAYPLIEYKRDIGVWGSFEGEVPENSCLKVELLDEHNDIVRYACSKKKDDRNLYIGHPLLTSYKEELDPGKEKLKEYGFPELQVKELGDPLSSIHDATIKCFFNDEGFKAILVSGTDIEHGRTMNTGLDLKDENGRPYETLACGDYTIRVSLSDEKGNVIASADKKIKIGKRKEVVIVRFNPKSHRQKMTEWCEREGFSIINDTLPGYLEPYLGDWYYHMGILPYYRSNDIAVYADAKVHMFVYLCDPSSTSYETELAYLQTKGQVEDKDMFKAYHYDIGEALLGKGRSYERNGKICEFGDDDLWLYRIEEVNEKAKENIFDLSEETILDVHYDVKRISVKAGSRIAISGVVKPWQLRKDDVILKDDNTYAIRHEVSKIHYTIFDGEKTLEEKRSLLMERIDGTSIGRSVYEFYNLFEIKDTDKGKKLRFELEAQNDEGRSSFHKITFVIDVI